MSLRNIEKIFLVNLNRSLMRKHYFGDNKKLKILKINKIDNNINLKNKIIKLI